MQADLARETAAERRARLEQELNEETSQREAGLKRSRVEASLEEQEAERIAA